MTLGVGRKMPLNFTTLAMLLSAARAAGEFAVRPLVDSTGFHEAKVKGYQSWARAMQLVHGTELTPLAHYLLAHDRELIQPLTRAVCYVEIASNPEAEVASYICQRVLPDVAAHDQVISIDEVVSILGADNVGTGTSATNQPRTDAALFLGSLHSNNGFGALGILRQERPGRYATGQLQLGPQLSGYTLLRRWPANTAYLRLAQAHQLLAPLLLDRTRFLLDLAVLERQDIMVRVTSSGLDQVRPIVGCRPEDILWTNT